MNIFNRFLVRVSEEFRKKCSGFVNGEKYAPSCADAQVFGVSQAGLRRRGRVGGRGYLAVHPAVVVARCGCRTVGAICSLVNEEDGCTASCRSMSPLPWYTLGKRKNCIR